MNKTYTIVADTNGTGVRADDLVSQPDSRDFRDAWVLDGAAISEDMDLSREILRTEIRAAREPLLAAEDVAYIRADEVGDEAAKRASVARKQALRDAPALLAIDAATTIDELRTAWPANLFGDYHE
jgi:hypothetical protein